MTVLADVRHAMRQFRFAPMFTATLVVTLALGIGACTSIFSLIDAVMLKSFPVTDPSRLYQIGIGKSCYLTDAEAPYCDVPSMSWLRLVGRLKPGANPAAVGERVTILLRHWLTGEAALAPQYQSQLNDELSQQVIPLGSDVVVALYTRRRGCPLSGAWR